MKERTMEREYLDGAAQVRHATTIKEHPDSPEAAHAREELLRAHRPLIRKLASRYIWRAGQYRDLVDAGVAGYFQAVYTFDSTRGALWPYARRNVLGAVQDEAYFLNAGAVAVPESARADLLRLRRLDPGNVLDDAVVAQDMHVSVERVRELRMLSRRSGWLESPIGGDKSKTVGENIPDEQRFPGYSKMFESQYAALGRRTAQTDEVARWITALYTAFAEDEIGERNRRIVLSHLQESPFAVVAAMLLGYLDGGHEVRVMTDYRFPVDASSEKIGGPGAAAAVVSAVTKGWPVDGKAQADRAHTDRELKRAWMRAWLKSQTPRPTLSAIKEAWKKTQIVAATPRIGISFDWPSPQAAPDIARALGVTERAIYKVIGKFNRALAEIRAEEEDQT